MDHLYSYALVCIGHEPASGIRSVESEQAPVIYSLDGRRRTTLTRGLNIVIDGKGRRIISIIG